MKLSGIFPEGTGCAVAEILILADQLQGGQKQRREGEKEASVRREAQLDSRSDTRGGKNTGRLTGPGEGSQITENSSTILRGNGGGGEGRCGRTNARATLASIRLPY